MLDTDTMLISVKVMAHRLQANLCNLLNFNESCNKQDKGHFETGRGIIDSNLIHSTDLSLVRQSSFHSFGTSLLSEPEYDASRTWSIHQIVLAQADQAWYSINAQRTQHLIKVRKSNNTLMHVDIK